MVRRSTARPGDVVCVSGTIGDAALGLALRRDPSLGVRWQLDASARHHLDAAYRTPEPPTALAAAVRACASAAMDISDGLVKDFDRLCRTAGVGGRIKAAYVPLSAPARAVIGGGGATLSALLTGGEDYEVLAAIAPERAAEFERLAAAAGAAVTRIGSIEDAGAGVSVVDAAGRAMAFARTGWDHFREQGGGGN
jgi:thiamine-monophosphate kinase